MITPRTEHDFWIGEPMDLEFEDLRVRRGGAFLNALTLAYQFHDVDVDDANNPGDAIADLTGAVAIDSGDADEDGDDDGDYYGRIDQSDDLDDALEPDTTYFIRIYGSSGSTAVNRWLKVRAQYRAET